MHSKKHLFVGLIFALSFINISCSKESKESKQLKAPKESMIGIGSKKSGLVKSRDHLPQSGEFAPEENPPVAPCDDPIKNKIEKQKIDSKFDSSAAPSLLTPDKSTGCKIN